MFWFKKNQDNLKKFDIFITEWRYQIDMQKKLFDTIDSKTQWFFLVIWWTIGYLVSNEFATIKIINTLCSIKLLGFTAVIVLGFTILWIGVKILNTKLFLTWPHVKSQVLNFWSDKKYEDLVENSAAAYIKSYSGNEETIRKKAWLLKIMINMSYIYTLFIVAYFLI